MSQQIPILVPSNPNTPTYQNSSVSPWARQPPIIHPPSSLYPYPKQDHLPKALNDQVQLVKTIQQMLMTKQQKMEWMMNHFQASNQGFQPGHHSIRQIMSHQCHYPFSGKASAVKKENPNHISIEDLLLVGEEIRKQKSNSALQS